MDEEPAFEFITKPELYGAIPEPEPASHELPAWYKNLPLESDGGVERSRLKNSTVRACMPFLEALKMGWILKLPADVQIKCADGEFNAGSMLDHGVVDTFSGHQVGKMFPSSGHLINFSTHWRVNAPDGWSFLLTHPMNRPGESRFQAFSGVIDVDKYDDQLKQPSLFTQNFEGVIPQGTPIQQIVPIHRDWLDMSSVARPATEDEELDRQRQKRSVDANQRHYREEQWEPIDAARVESDSDWEKEE